MTRRLLRSTFILFHRFFLLLLLLLHLCPILAASPRQLPRLACDTGLHCAAAARSPASQNAAAPSSPRCSPAALLCSTPRPGRCSAAAAAAALDPTQWASLLSCFSSPADATAAANSSLSSVGSASSSSSVACIYWRNSPLATSARPDHAAAAVMPRLASPHTSLLRDTYSRRCCPPLFCRRKALLTTEKLSPRLCGRPLCFVGSCTGCSPFSYPSRRSVPFAGFCSNTCCGTCHAAAPAASFAVHTALREGRFLLRPARCRSTTTCDTETARTFSSFYSPLDPLLSPSLAAFPSAFPPASCISFPPSDSSSLLSRAVSRSLRAFCVGAAYAVPPAGDKSAVFLRKPSPAAGLSVARSDVAADDRGTTPTAVSKSAAAGGPAVPADSSSVATGTRPAAAAVGKRPAAAAAGEGRAAAAAAGVVSAAGNETAFLEAATAAGSDRGSAAATAAAVETDSAAYVLSVPLDEDAFGTSPSFSTLLCQPSSLSSSSSISPSASVPVSSLLSQPSDGVCRETTSFAAEAAAATAAAAGLTSRTRQTPHRPLLQQQEQQQRRSEGRAAQRVQHRGVKSSSEALRDVAAHAEEIRRSEMGPPLVEEEDLENKKEEMEEEGIEEGMKDRDTQEGDQEEVYDRRKKTAWRSGESSAGRLSGRVAEASEREEKNETGEEPAEGSGSSEETGRGRLYMRHMYSSSMLGERRREVVAVARYVRLSPIKTRRVLQEIRGLSVGAALARLVSSPRRPALAVFRVLQSAVANALHAVQQQQQRGAAAQLGWTSKLLRPRIKEITANNGPVMKRPFFRARGKMDVRRRPTTHIRVVLQY